MNKILYIVTIACLFTACTATNKTTISPYSGSTGHNALVYGLPQTRLYFEVEIVKTFVKKGPYAEYATRMLGLQDVPLKDAESWKISSIRIYDKQEVDNTQLYALSFIDYPQNINHLLKFTKSGMILDASADNVLVNSRFSGSISDDIRFMNTVINSTVTEKVDTFYKTILTDTAFVRIPVLQRKVLGKTTEDQAREAADQIFNIRKGRLDVITANLDHIPDGNALKLMLDAIDLQEQQLLSLFSGARAESRYVYTYSALPEEAGTTTPLFYFSEKTGIVAPTASGAKAVWYKTGDADIPSNSNLSQTTNVVYYRIPQIVEISAGTDKTTMVSKQKEIFQFGKIVSFPLLAPEK
ncbi:MAG: DUF4831 family protein [Bacteroidales bacterium]|nr:DUF4831 family protein [Bacteroidales bacterium]